MMLSMRTTVSLDPDAFHAAKAKAAHERKSLGRAISELILQGLSEKPRTGRRKAAAVFRSHGGVYTTEQVEAALDEE